MSPDIPPVPPLPEQYQLANRFMGNNNPSPTVFNPLGMHPITQPVSDERDSKMPPHGFVGQGHYGGHINTDEDDDGMFRMEE